jgi:hypothetical protein
LEVREAGLEMAHADRQMALAGLDPAFAGRQVRNANLQEAFAGLEVREAGLEMAHADRQMALAGLVKNSAYRERAKLKPVYKDTQRAGWVEPGFISSTFQRLTEAISRDSSFVADFERISF